MVLGRNTGLDTQAVATSSTTHGLGETQAFDAETQLAIPLDQPI
jgi:hypothetical protein